MRDEGPFFLEWLAYHRLVGFNRFVIFSNDCSDRTHEMLQELDRAGVIHHFDNSELRKDLPNDPQGRAYARANAMPLVRESDWIMVMDGDEFVRVKVGDGTLDALFAAMPAGGDAIGLPWRIFGSGGVIAFDERLQIDAFRRAAPLDFAISPNHLAIKTLFRPDLAQRFGTHRPIYKEASGTAQAPVLFVNGSGKDITEHLLRGGRWAVPPQQAGYDLAQVNHYMIRAHEVFLMKRWRGAANGSNPERIDFDYFDKYNNNFEVDDGMAPWVGHVAAEMGAIKDAVPGLARLIDEATAIHARRISELKTLLAAESPTEFKRLFDPQTVAAELAAQERHLIAVRRRLGPGASVRRLPPLSAQPAPAAPAERPGRGLVSSGRVAAEEAEEAMVENTDTPEVSTSAAPSWLADLRNGPYKRGFFQSFDQTGVHYVERDPQNLVISFDNLSAVRTDQIERESWGYGFVRKGGWSHMGVYAYVANWFRDGDLLDYLADLSKRGFFQRFKSVTMIGTSMGAYAATAFAPLAPGCRVVAFSPQSTLSEPLVPWEDRYHRGRKKVDWSGPLSDGAEGARAAGKVWLVYDPGVVGDGMHADRYQGDNIHRLRARHADHKTALFLRRAGLLGTVVREAVADTLTEERFYALYRQGRTLPWYLGAVAERIAASSRPQRLHLLEAYLRRVDRSQMASGLYQKFPQIMGGARQQEPPSGHGRPAGGPSGEGQRVPCRS